MPRTFVIVVVLAVMLAACTGGSQPVTSGASSGLSGGTLRVVDFAANPLDPQTGYAYDSWELFRCCLLRTLLSYPGLPTDLGGSDLHPDLASAMPTQSTDGLTWSFDLKAGIYYAPPFDMIEIVAGDVVRALERMGDPNVNSTDPSVSYNYSFYYSVIAGFDDYRSGRAATISGLEASDDHTLKVHLTAPAGQLGFLFALPASAPIPEGAADGHDSDYGSFLAASGPYMFEGAESIDYHAPPDRQVPASGYVPARPLNGGGFVHGSLALVRNPSWDPSTDALRQAYADRIEIDLRGITNWDGKEQHLSRVLGAAFDAVRAGERDLVLDLDPPPDVAAEYAADPGLSHLFRTQRNNTVTFLAMNLAVPPFEDPHVRRAVSLVIDKSQIAGRLAAIDFPINGVPAEHVVPDSMEEGLLSSWEPAWVQAGDQDPFAAARGEMRQSAYDENGDGRCDDQVCSNVNFVVDEFWPREFFPPVRRDLGMIGITFTVDRVPYGSGSRNPEDHVALSADRWMADFPDASDFFPLLFSLLGATPEQLVAWGYDVTRVPSIDAWIDRCAALAGQARVQCWAKLDLKISDDIVPWVPILFETTSRTVSPRVIRFSFDQFVAYPALDRIALAPEETGSPSVESPA